MRYTNYKRDTLRIYVAYLASGKGANKNAEVINKSKKALEEMLDGINIRIYFDKYNADMKKNFPNFVEVQNITKSKR